MKILTAAQIREADRFTIAHEPISSIDLMERAATRLFDFLQPMIDPKKSISILCGTGNNGGDGLVLARLLAEHHYNVEVFCLPLGSKSEDFEHNETRLPIPLKDAQEFTTSDIIVDALFGSGLSRPLAGKAAELIARLNEIDAWKIAIDMPSGLFSDEFSPKDAIFKADLTVTFQHPKLALMMPENGPYAGHWETLNIDLLGSAQAETPYFFITDQLAGETIQSRGKFSHKGTFGKGLLIAGSKGKMGAAVLASKAAMRAGAGLLTTYIPRSGNVILQTAVPESMVLLDEGDDHITAVPDMTLYDTVGIGPGIGTDSQTDYVLEEVLRLVKHPMVLDADALNLIARKPNYLQLIPPNSILTPHPGEFQRLVGGWENDFDRLRKQMEFAGKYYVIVILKGAHSSVALPDGRVYFNSTGNPGMATGGCGDVLTGILTGLLCQKYTPADAAIFGTFLHGKAGDLAAEDLTEPALIASDVIEYLPDAYAHI